MRPLPDSACLHARDPATAKPAPLIGDFLHFLRILGLLGRRSCLTVLGSTPTRRQALSFRLLGKRLPGVRHQGFWTQWRAELRNSLAHLMCLIMRLACAKPSVQLPAVTQKRSAWDKGLAAVCQLHCRSSAIALISSQICEWLVPTLLETRFADQDVGLAAV